MVIKYICTLSVPVVFLLSCPAAARLSVPVSPVTPSDFSGGDESAFNGLASGPSLKLETVSQQWSLKLGAWVDARREVYSYDGGGLVSEYLVQSPGPSGWKPQSRTIYRRTAAGLVLQSLQQRWSGSDWNDAGRTTYAYDGEGRLLERLGQTLVLGQWENRSGTYYKYDSLGRTIWDDRLKGYGGMWRSGTRRLYSFVGATSLRSRLQSLRLSDTVWTNSSQSFYEYDSLGRLVSQLSQRWKNDTWVDGARTEYAYTNRGFLADRISRTISGGEWWNQSWTSCTYRPDGKILEQTDRVGVGTEWVNQVRSLAKYQENELLARTIFERWVDGRWEESQEQYYRYDRDGRIVMHRVRNDGGSGMENWWLTSTEYDEGGNPAMELEQRWDAGEWANVSRTFTVWSGLTASEESFVPAGGYSLSENYPNPFNPATTITFTLDETAPVSLKIYDLLGREVAALIDGILPGGTHSIHWEAGDRAGGVYFFRLTAGDFHQTKRMLLVR